MFDSLEFWSTVGTWVSVGVTAGAGLVAAYKFVKALNERKRAHSLYLVPCACYATLVAEWFKTRFAKFEDLAKAEAFRTQDPVAQQSALERAAREVEGFPGGIYAINDDAVSAQYTPHARDVPNLVGFKVTQRSYYEACTRHMKPIVSDAIDSANRHVKILVLAVPRFDEAGRFIGILDGVIDLVRAPFSEMARKVLKNGSSPAHDPKLRLVLIDGLRTVIGSSHGQVDGTQNLGGDHLVGTLLDALADGDEGHCSSSGAVSRVDGTQFAVVCYRASRSIPHEN